MEFPDDDADRPDEIDRDTDSTEFGENDEAAQEAEWTEDAEEGGSS